MDDLGARVWPVLGAVYVLEAVKRVRGMRLVGLSRRAGPAMSGAPTVVANRQRAAWSVEEAPSTSSPAQAKVAHSPARPVPGVPHPVAVARSYPEIERNCQPAQSPRTVETTTA